MAGGPVIKDDVKHRVMLIQQENPDWGAKEVKEEVHKWFGECRTPKLRSIQKLLAKGKEQAQFTRFRKLGQQWHLGALNESPISAEAVHKVIEVQKVIRNLELETGLPPESWSESFPSLTSEDVVSLLAALSTILRPVSIRQALWIDRLHAAVNEPFWLWIVSLGYCVYEDLCDLAGTDFDTREFDENLRRGDYLEVLQTLAALVPSAKRLSELVGTFTNAGGEIEASEEAE